MNLPWLLANKPPGLRGSGCGLRRRRLCPSRRFLQLLFVSSNSPSEWNLQKEAIPKTIRASLVLYANRGRTCQYWVRFAFAFLCKHRLLDPQWIKNGLWVCFIWVQGAFTHLCPPHLTFLILQQPNRLWSSISDSDTHGSLAAVCLWSLKEHLVKERKKKLSKIKFYK